MNTHPVCGWLFPTHDDLELSLLSNEEMATALAELEAGFPSDEFDQAVTEYMLMDDYELDQTYRLRCAYL
jgi:hypothetical protein